MNIRRTCHNNKWSRAVVNSSPLIYIYEDEVEEVLTLSHLYCGKRLLDKQINKSSDDGITEINTAENSAKRDIWIKLYRDLGQKWQNEYFINLRESNKVKTREKLLKINVGDEFDDLGSELREVNRIDQLLIDQGGVNVVKQLISTKHNLIK